MPPTPTVLGLGAGRADRPPPSPGEPSVVASPERHRLDLWHDGSHLLNRLVRVVPGFLSAEQGATLAWPVVTATLEMQLPPVFADLGRIHAGSPSMPLACAADALIVVCRGDMASVQHMMWRLDHLVPAIADRNGHPPAVIPVVVASHRNGARAAKQVSELLAESPVAPTLQGVGWLAWDPAGANALQEGADPWAKPLRKSELMKSARSVMSLLASATGLDHGEPITGRKRARRRNDSADATGTTGAPVVSGEAVNSEPPVAAATHGVGVSADEVADSPVPSFEGLRRGWDAARGDGGR
ncbi:hypothetical protein BSP109_02860 [Brevibacterium sp. Mu109]|nr:hypothetical protein BSP109_02860 [Brevibacterium sp. Mu109]